MCVCSVCVCVVCMRKYRIARNFLGINFHWLGFSKVFANKFLRMSYLPYYSSKNSRILIFEDKTKSTKTSEFLSLENL